MAYIMGQVNVVQGGSTVPLFVVPASLCNVTFWNSATAITYVGTSKNVTATNGMQCHSIPTSFFSYVGCAGATFYGMAPTGTGATAQINYIISTDFG